MKSTSNKTIYGVIGAGSFGTAVANILAENGEVILYARRQVVIDSIQATGENRGQKMNPRVRMTNDLESLCQQCNIIFPVVPSSAFRKMMQSAAPFLKPHHILIHGTKGLNVLPPDGSETLQAGIPVSRMAVRTMSDIILEESVVLRVGCLSGPNLAKEIAQGQPAATVIASRFDEVIKHGQTALKSPRFRVYSSHDITGVELAGVLKNVMAIASGILNGLELGENAKAMLISRGLGEIVKIGKALGAKSQVFFGLAGIGDLIATCSSNLSRNFTVGHRLAKGEDLDHILETMKEVAEGVKTVKLAKSLCLHYGIKAPIVETLFQILYNKQGMAESMQYLMTNDLSVDADFWE